MSWIIQLFGMDYGLQLVISILGIFECMICTFVFNFRTRKKKNFHLWALFSVFIGIIFMFSLAGLRLATLQHQMVKNFIHVFVMTSYMFLVIFFCYEQSISKRLLTFCATNACLLLTGRMYSLLINIAGFDDKQNMNFFTTGNESADCFLYFLIHTVIYIAITIIFERKTEVAETRETKRNIVVFSLVSIIITNILFTLSDPYQSESWALTIIIKVFCCLVSLVVLLMRSGLFLLSKKDEENMVLSGIFSSQKEQFDNLRLSIDIINSKCHDLRHRLDEIGDRLTAEELNSFKEATRIYDSTIKTGYDVLDAVIYEKKLLCNQKKIRLTVLADGKLLSFMNPTEIYSLIGNILNNAIEASQEVEEEKRFIDFTLREKCGLILLDVTNNCSNKVVLGEDGLPISTKTDGTNHGYGSKSIYYIAERYNGVLSYKTGEDSFSLLLSFQKS